MKVFGRALSMPERPGLRKTETLISSGVFLAVLAAIGAAFLLRDLVTPEQAGYGGVALASLVASAGFIIPVPALFAVCGASTVLVPLLVGLIAGTSETVGELSGYFLGYSGRGVVRRSRLYRRLEPWMQQRGWLLLFLLSLVPNPVFDVVGVAAGTLRYPLLGFLGTVWVGKALKFVIFAYACAYSVAWLKGLFELLSLRF